MEEHSHLPRLIDERYRGFAAVHWTMTIDHRARGWLDPPFHARFREILLHTCVRYDLLCPIYCLMPDHMHVLLRGISRQADQLLAVSFLRRYVNELLDPHRFQKQAHDNVLRHEDLEREAFRAVAFYIAENPVRAGLCKTAADHPFTGAILPGFPALDVHHPKYWDVFWTQHEALLRKNGYEG
jgi:REP element-mobilizing transposase RayT